MDVRAYGLFYRAMFSLSKINEARRIILGVGDYLYSLVGGPRRCCDCGVLEGELHERGCDQETCPFCGGQLIGCDCDRRKFYPTYVPSSRFKRPGDSGYLEFTGLPEEVYKNGLPPGVSIKWEHMLEDRGRIPFILYPNLCARCGRKWPKMFRVPNADWQRYVAPEHHGDQLCERCYLKIKRWIDTRSGAPELLRRMRERREKCEVKDE